MESQVSNRANVSHTRRRIIETAVQFYRRIGHKKTTVADIAREMAMSPANVYRFFGSKQSIAEAVVGELLEEIVLAAVNAAQSAGPAIWRLQTVLHAVNRLHVKRLTDEKKLHDLVALAMQENWPVINSYADRITRIASRVITVGQARGELRDGNSMILARCVLCAMEHIRTRCCSQDVRPANTRAGDPFLHRCSSRDPQRKIALTEPRPASRRRTPPDWRDRKPCAIPPTQHQARSTIRFPPASTSAIALRLLTRPSSSV